MLLVILRDLSLNFHGFCDRLYNLTVYYRLYWNFCFLHNCRWFLNLLGRFRFLDDHLVLRLRWDDRIRKLRDVIVYFCCVEETGWGLCGFLLPIFAADHEPFQVMHHFFPMLSSKHASADLLDASFEI